MNNELLQIGLGGLLALLLIREVFTFLRMFLNKKNGSGKETVAGDKPVEFWQAEIRKAVIEANTPLIKAVEALTRSNEELSRGIQKLVFFAESSFREPKN